MVIITGQVPTHAIGQDAFQEVRHGRHHAPLREAQLPGEGREGPRDHDQEGVLHRDHRAARPGAGGHPEGRVRADKREFDYPETISMRSYNPVVKGHAGRSRRRCSCCSRPSGR